jgi:hypothetical protein
MKTVNELMQPYGEDAVLVTPLAMLGYLLEADNAHELNEQFTNTGLVELRYRPDQS